MTGPKTLEEWIAIYEERDSDTDYVLSPGERVLYHPDHGFATIVYDAAANEILVPKMCGDGRHWRKLIYQMVLATGSRGAYCCTKRNPMAYMRILGGKLVKMTHEYDFRTGKETTLWYIFITPEDSKERGKHADIADLVSDSAAECGAREGGIVEDR